MGDLSWISVNELMNEIYREAATKDAEDSARIRLNRTDRTKTTLITDVNMKPGETVTFNIHIDPSKHKVIQGEVIKDQKELEA